MELLEYVDVENKEILGIEERENIHNNGLWHREVAIWVLNEKNELLLQRRSNKKKQAPNKLSITAGHIDVNELPENAAIRELGEEVGIKVGINDLIFLGIYKKDKPDNKCFSYTYLIKTTKKINEMVIQEEEVSELKYITIGELENRIKAGDKEINFVENLEINSILGKIKGII